LADGTYVTRLINRDSLRLEVLEKRNIERNVFGRQDVDTVGTANVYKRKLEQGVEFTDNFSGRA